MAANLANLANPILGLRKLPSGQRGEILTDLYWRLASDVDQAQGPTPDKHSI